MCSHKPLVNIWIIVERVGASCPADLESFARLYACMNCMNCITCMTGVPIIADNGSATRVLHYIMLQIRVSTTTFSSMGLRGEHQSNM